MSEPLRYELRTQLVGLLPRLRQTVPFPIDPSVVYSGAFSPEVARWFAAPPSTRLHHRSIAHRNLLRATARNTIIHFNLADPAKINDSSDKNPDQAFWIRMEDCPVCPSSRLSPFLLDDTVRNDLLLQSWYRRADLLDLEIRYYHDKIYAIAPLFANKTDIALAWPEVARAVPSVGAGARPPTPSRTRREETRVETIKAKIAEKLTPSESARLTEMLATAVMLPAVDEAGAWIGYNREDLP